MPEPQPLSASDQELLGQLARFVERVSGREEIWINRGYSRSLAAPVTVLVAIGEQAMFLDKVLLDKPAPSPIIAPELYDGKF